MWVLLLQLALATGAAATCTTEQNFALGGPTIKTTTAASYGECCDACIQATGCRYWSWGPKNTCLLKATAASRAPSPGHWCGWAGTGPAPPPPSPPVAPGKWSPVHAHVSCEQSGSKYIKDEGNKVPLATCKAQCVADPQCFFINHADGSDDHCVLYGSCATPALCGRSRRERTP